jgi:hypothetical protein
MFINAIMVTKVVYIDENAVIIECEHVPLMGKADVASASQLEAAYCVNCGYHRDADLRAQERMMKSNGQKTFSISCFSPKSPYLEPLKQQLREKGLIK